MHVFGYLCFQSARRSWSWLRLAPLPLKRRQPWLLRKQRLKAHQASKLQVDGGSCDVMRCQLNSVLELWNIRRCMKSNWSRIEVYKCSASWTRGACCFKDFSRAAFEVDWTWLWNLKLWVPRVPPWISQHTPKQSSDLQNCFTVQKELLFLKFWRKWKTWKSLAAPLWMQSFERGSCRSTSFRLPARQEICHQMRLKTFGATSKK